MTDPVSQPDADPQALLADIRQALQAQLAMARQGQADDLLASVHQLDGLLATLRPDLLPEDLQPQLAEIRRLHQQLCLGLAASLQETATNLRRLQHGKRTLRAYRM